ncbi:virulence-associated E family protein [Vibrio parahaemolyticus]|uniref:virulence-associated E family protein n=2 Tax=Vibrio parahaemolyticus TaxID=670 RepID=UPI001CF439D3|nr:virulence-associated E family protein [Vibrio parahaemolyticus]MCA6691495.1 virulence-associated E family protein [Vibrio parahaemolyticus]MDF5585833.1 virulence-associated E family protein [Vibrio parahaemolyticus]MDF5591031.1 virulence-associated E family protein [Vibrio parahaemolyticus]MDG2871693.1 virulence-associated E family protein [Vibrio parahaemolyticus]MDG2888205.1 virulence-associated E family protein [Vibrio parahaemolyticus]
MFNESNAPEFPHVRYKESGQQVPLCTADNLKALLKSNGYEAKFNKMTLEADIFKDNMCMDKPDIVRSELVSLTSIYSLPKSAIDEHFNAIASENSYHPIADWLDEEWDSVPRVDTVLNCLKAKNPTLSNIVLLHWLVACVACLFVRNFKSKLVPVLQGEQSFKKTAFVERVANVMPSAFLEGAELNPDNKDRVLSVIRSWVVELGELERSTKNCQGALKAFVTRACDTVRPPYSRTDIKKDRQTNLIATVNGTDFLKDETGNTRYAVIELVGETDMDTLNKILGWEYKATGELTLKEPENLRQFWLEVKHKFMVEHHPWMLSPEIQAQVSQESAQYVDKGNWYNVLNDHLEECTGKAREWLSTKQVCEHINADPSKGSVIGKALNQLAKDGKLDKKMLNGSNRYCFPTVRPQTSFR